MEPETNVSLTQRELSLLYEALGTVVRPDNIMEVKALTTKLDIAGCVFFLSAVRENMGK